MDKFAEALNEAVKDALEEAGESGQIGRMIDLKKALEGAILVARLRLAKETFDFCDKERAAGRL